MESRDQDSLLAQQGSGTLAFYSCLCLLSRDRQRFCSADIGVMCVGVSAHIFGRCCDPTSLVRCSGEKLYRRIEKLKKDERPLALTSESWGMAAGEPGPRRASSVRFLSRLRGRIRCVQRHETLHTSSMNTHSSIGDPGRDRSGCAIRICWLLKLCAEKDL